MPQLSGRDVSFLYIEGHRERRPSVSHLFIYDPSAGSGAKVTIKQIVDRFKRSLPMSDVFCQRAILSSSTDPSWIEDEYVDLEFHARHIALQHPSTWRQPWIEVARFQSRPLDLSRPPWEICVIEGHANLQGVPPGCSAIFRKTHPAAIDGQPGMDIATAIPRSRTGPTLPDVDHQCQHERPPAPSELLLRTRRQQRHQVDRAGATASDAVLAIVGGALRQYLGEQGELPDSSLVASAPISVRTEAESGTGGNQMSSM